MVLRNVPPPTGPSEPKKDIKGTPPPTQGAKANPLKSQGSDQFVSAPQNPVSEAVQQVASTVAPTVEGFASTIRSFFSGPKGLSDNATRLVAKDAAERYEQERGGNIT